jgi:predicted acylesterase/phospholipase RssA
MALASGFGHEKFLSTTVELRDRVSNKRFINKWRFWRVVDVDFLVKELVSLLGSTEEVWRALEFQWIIVTTDENGRPEYTEVGNDVDLEELAILLRATMSIPVLYPRGVHISEKKRFDGGISDPLPLIATLLRSRGRSVYAISNVRNRMLGRDATGLERWLVRVWPGIPERIRGKLLSRNGLGAVTADIINAGELLGTPIVSVFPVEGEYLGSRTDITHLNLDRIFSLGAQRAMESLNVK